jgi:hypothetical protein
MSDLLSYEDFYEITNKAIATNMTNAEGMDDLFETWGYDPKAVADVAIKAVKFQAEEYKLPPSRELAATIMGIFVTGFVIGNMAAHEVELRRQADA